MTTPNKKDKEALGKGIRSLLQGIDLDLKTSSGSLKTSVAESITGILRVPLDQIETNPKQPRKDFDENALQELAASIRIHDIIQPVTVAKLPSGKYRSHYRRTPLSRKSYRRHQGYSCICSSGE